VTSQRKLKQLDKKSLKNIYLYSPSDLHQENKADVTNAMEILDEALSKRTDIAFVYPSSRHQTKALLEIPQFRRCENNRTSNATASSQTPKVLRIEINKF